MAGSFLDTSALAKHYHIEAGSAKVDRQWGDLATGYSSRGSVLWKLCRSSQARYARAILLSLHSLCYENGS